MIIKQVGSQPCPTRLSSIGSSCYEVKLRRWGLGGIEDHVSLWGMNCTLYGVFVQAHNTLLALCHARHRACHDVELAGSFDWVRYLTGPRLHVGLIPCGIPRTFAQRWNLL